MELIDRSTLGREIPLKVCLPCPMGEDFECKDCLLDKAMGIIEAAPTIDAVPVVRCGECNRRLHLCTFDDGSEHFQCTNDKSPCFFAPEVLGTDYCPYGERGEATQCP